MQKLATNRPATTRQPKLLAVPVFLLILAACCTGAQAQSSAAESGQPSGNSDASLNDSVRELRDQVRELRAVVAAMSADCKETRAEAAELRHELQLLRDDRKKLAQQDMSAGASESDADGSSSLSKEQAASRTESAAGERQLGEGQVNEPANQPSAEEQLQLLSSKVDDQYQTKVESASKYHLRLSGIVLFNLFSNQGTVDNIDIPELAYAPSPGQTNGSFGATLRQSEIGLETFGPTLFGARTRGELQLDFAGGFPAWPNGVNTGLVRLRTAAMHIDWEDTSIVAGQDAIFFSPNSPTSFASLASPALSYAGNLWGWIPQIRVEHKISLADDSSVLFQGGILDPVAGEYPSTSWISSYSRQAGPGEASRQPAYASRIAWTRDFAGQPLRFGVAGYYSRQNYGFVRNINGWAGMADFDIPLGSHFSLSGEFYRGAALGGLYGGLGRSVLFSGDPTQSNTQVLALNTVGGWTQLKYRPATKWEMNAAFGLDNSFAGDLNKFPYAESYGDPNLARNRGALGNVIYRPKSDLLFSAEYHRLNTYSLYGDGIAAGQVNLVVGVLF